MENQIFVSPDPTYIHLVSDFFLITLMDNTKIKFLNLFVNLYLNGFITLFF